MTKEKNAFPLTAHRLHECSTNLAKMIRAWGGLYPNFLPRRFLRGNPEDFVKHESLCRKSLRYMINIVTISEHFKALDYDSQRLMEIPLFQGNFTSIYKIIGKTSSYTCLYLCEPVVVNQKKRRMQDYYKQTRSARYLPLDERDYLGEVTLAKSLLRKPSVVYEIGPVNFNKPQNKKRNNKNKKKKNKNRRKKKSKAESESDDEDDFWLLEKHEKRIKHRCPDCYGHKRREIVKRGMASVVKKVFDGVNNSGFSFKNL